MQNLTILQPAKITEGEAMQSIFDACRGNYMRNPRELQTGMVAFFHFKGNGCYTVALHSSYDTSFLALATAEIDSHDI
jgi:hypothetical protein